jgi:hypothetical protein
MSTAAQAAVLTSIVLWGICGCAHDEGKYKILREVRSPDGKTLAQLVQRESRAALSADTYFIVLSQYRLDEGSLHLAYQERDRPFLDVTNGQNLLLEWTAPKNLGIVCNNCGLEDIDVMTKRPEANGISVSYKGFPVGTAYSNK